MADDREELAAEKRPRHLIGIVKPIELDDFIAVIEKVVA